MNRILKRLAAHGVANRKQALTYINGDIFLDSTHPRGIFQYLLRNGLLKKFIFDFYNQRYSDRLDKNRLDKMINKELQRMEQQKRFNTQLKENLWEYGVRHLSFTDIPIALGHYIKNFAGKEAIYLIIPSITNISINDVIQGISNKYPNATILDDDTNEILYTPNSYSNITNEKSWFICKIPCDNTNGLENLETSIFDQILRKELLSITSQPANIEYFMLGIAILIKINLQSSDDDDNIADHIYIAVRDAVSETNKYFLNNKIDNYLTPPSRYKFEY